LVRLAQPLANSNVFNLNYVPTTPSGGWTGNPGLYNNVFKYSCRVCHISRDSTGSFQFDSLSKLTNSFYGYGPVCSSLSMPHSQRTWGVFWGSRGANNLGASGVPNMPTLIGTAAGLNCH